MGSWLGRSALYVATVVSAVVDIGIETAVFAAAAVIEGALLAITRYIPRAGLSHTVACRSVPSTRARRSDPC